MSHGWSLLVQGSNSLGYRAEDLDDIRAAELIALDQNVFHQILFAQVQYEVSFLLIASSSTECCCPVK